MRVFEVFGFSVATGIGNLVLRDPSDRDWSHNSFFGKSWCAPNCGHAIMDSTNDTAEEFNDALWRFEEAWKAFVRTEVTKLEPPNLAGDVPPTEHSDRKRTQVELIKLELEYRWRPDHSKAIAPKIGRKRLAADFAEWPELDGDDTDEENLRVAEVAKLNSAGQPIGFF